MKQVLKPGPSPFMRVGLNTPSSIHTGKRYVSLQGYLAHEKHEAGAEAGADALDARRAPPPPRLSLSLISRLDHPLSLITYPQHRLVSVLVEGKGLVTCCLSLSLVSLSRLSLSLPG